jgi:hypothetical protein
MSKRLALACLSALMFASALPIAAGSADVRRPTPPLPGWRPAPPQQAVPVIAPTGNQLQWNQAGPDLPTVQGYVYTALVDGSTTPTSLTATCSGTASPFTCTAPLPVVTPGQHTMTVTAAQVLTGGTQLTGTPSAQCAYDIAATPAQPTNLQIVKIIAAILGVIAGILAFFH